MGSLRRVFVFGLTLVLGGGMAVGLGPASAAAATGGASGGGSYLAGQLTGGDHLVNSYGADYGLSADLAIALAAAGDQDAALARTAGYLRAHVADYADPAGTTQYPGPYSGAVAKLALLAEITGQDPSSFGGFDLLHVLSTDVCTAPDSSGYLCTAAGDFYQAYSTVSQALGVLALARAGVTVPAPAVTRLESLQCGDGGFSSALITSGTTCTSDVDTTSYAAQALEVAGGAATAVTAARDYLLSAQQPDGGFLGASGENSNSTGLAAQALLATASATTSARTTIAPAAITDPVAAATSFLLARQQGNGGFAINASTPGADVRSTTQAVPALAGTTLAALSDPVTPITPTSPPSSHPAPSTTAPSSSAAATAPAASSTNVPPKSSETPAAGIEALAATGAAPWSPLLSGLLLGLLGLLVLIAARRRPALIHERAGRRSKRRH